MRRLVWILVALLSAGPAAAACIGDCDGDGEVRINELVIAVGIALGQNAVGACPAADANGDGQVTIAELIGATNASLSGCSTGTTATPTASPSETPPPSPTAVANQPPVLATPFVYRGYAGQAIARPLGAIDPDGGAVACASDALLAGMSLDADNVLRWTPAADQLGPITVPVQCQDATVPPLAVDGDLAFRIVAPDPCVTLACDPASGCTATALPVTTLCCAPAAERPRLAEADVLCPQGRLLQIGMNTSGFGRLNSCDRLRFRPRAQTDAEIRFHIRVSCVNSLNRVTVKAKLESATRGTLVDAQGSVFLPSDPTDGFYERRNVTFPFTQAGPFFNIEETEANLTVTVRDSDGAQVSETVRVVLTSDPSLEDLPDP